MVLFFCKDSFRTAQARVVIFDMEFDDDVLYRRIAIQVGYNNILFIKLRTNYRSK